MNTIGSPPVAKMRGQDENVRWLCIVVQYTSLAESKWRRAMAKKRSKKKTRKATAKNAARKRKAKGRSRNAKRATGSVKKRSTKKVAKKAKAKKGARKAKVTAKATGAKRSTTPAKKRVAKRRPGSSPEKIEAAVPKEISVGTASDAEASGTIKQKVSNALTAAVEKLTSVFSGEAKGDASEADETVDAPIQH